MIIGVIGAGNCSKEQYEEAYKIGKIIAERGAILVTGGLRGVMEASSHGAHDAGGIVIGILPTARKEDANKYVKIPIITNAGHMRNIIIANTADSLIALYGSYGTLSEIAIALKIGKIVIGYNTWGIKGMLKADTPEEAVELALTHKEESMIT